jgi:predicted CXXCH cytochrome family protein
MKPSFAALFLTVAAAGTAVLFVACSSEGRVEIMPAFTNDGSTYVGNARCASCHTDRGKGFAHTAHAKLVVRDPAQAELKIGCEACHGPGSKHVDAGGGYRLITNPRKDPTGCFQCHSDVQAKMNLYSHHPVREGRMSCVDCHDPHGDDILQAKASPVARINDKCGQCHRDKVEPKLFEHLALREGCTVCHDVHGSINDKMLLSRNQTLCLRCHAQHPPTAPVIPRSQYYGTASMTGDVATGTCWSSQTGGCHTAVHGSNVQYQLKY